MFYIIFMQSFSLIHPIVKRTKFSKLEMFNSGTKSNSGPITHSFVNESF